MKLTTKLFAAIALLAVSASVFAQSSDQSGVSRPEDLHDTITVAAIPQAPPPAPPPTVIVATSTEVVPPVVAVGTIAPPELHKHTPGAVSVAIPLVVSPKANDIDAGVVTSVPSSPFELPEGTLLKVKLSETLSTGATIPGTAFYAHLAADVMKNGKVILPTGSTLAGRVTEVHGGHRIGGPASIHLRPDTITLPDGTIYTIEAQVIDSDLYRNVRISSEGTIIRSDHAAATLTAIGLASGSSAVAGAMLGGAPGALIGAGVGAGIGTAVWLRQDKQQTLDQGVGIIFSLTAPMDIRPTMQRASLSADRHPGN